MTENLVPHYNADQDGGNKVLVGYLTQEMAQAILSGDIEWENPGWVCKINEEMEYEEAE
jgi:hypothetical protein